MASYPAPTETLPIFSPSVFETNNIPLTIEEGADYFITYPTAQGAITIPTLSTGTLGTSGTATIATAAITTANTGTLNVSSVLNITNSSTKATIYGYGTTLPGAGIGEHNTAFGYEAGKGISTLTATGGNTAFGALALTSNTNGATNNTAVGHNALYSLTDGNGNTQVGTTTTALAANLTDGDNNTLIGFSASVSGTGISTSTAIGYLAQATASNQVVLGTATETTIVPGILQNNSFIRPGFTTVPTYTSADIGFINNATITYPGATTNTIASYTAPAGTWLCLVCLGFATGTGALSLTVKSASTTVGFIPKVFATGSTQDFYCGSVPIVISTGTSSLTLAPATAPSVGTVGANVGQYVKFIRIA